MGRINFLGRSKILMLIAIVFLIAVISSCISGCNTTGAWLLKTDDVYKAVEARYKILQSQFDIACKGNEEGEFCTKYKPKVDEAGKILAEIKIAIELSKPTEDLETKFITIEAELMGYILRELASK